MTMTRARVVTHVDGHRPKLLVGFFLVIAAFLAVGSVAITHMVAQPRIAQKKESSCAPCSQPRNKTQANPNAYVPKGDQPLTIPDEYCIYVVIPFSRGEWTANYDKQFHDFSEDMMAGLRPAIEAGVEFVGHSIDHKPMNLSERFIKMLGSSETVPEKVERRLKSPKATNTTCKWIVQARVDADDYLGEEFVPTLLKLLRHETAANKNLKAAVVHQRRLTRVYVFPLPDNKFSCILWKHRTQGVGPQVSTGFTLVMRRDIWEEEKSPSVLDGTFSTVFQRAQSNFGDDFSNLHFPPDGVTMSPVTQLSSHFPWFDPGPHKPCDFEEIEEYFGPAAAVHLSITRIPRVSIFDACTSNSFLIGILRRNTGKTNLDCQQFHEFWTKNQEAKDPLITMWPGR